MSYHNADDEHGTEESAACDVEVAQVVEMDADGHLQVHVVVGRHILDVDRLHYKFVWNTNSINLADRILIRGSSKWRETARRKLFMNIDCISKSRRLRKHSLLLCSNAPDTKC